jgi:hypothetical protein
MGYLMHEFMPLPGGGTLAYRLNYLKDTLQRYSFMVDTDHPLGNMRGTPYPEDVPVPVFGRQWCYIPFAEKGKATWLFEDKPLAILFQETYGGTKRFK